MYYFISVGLHEGHCKRSESTINSGEISRRERLQISPGQSTPSPAEFPEAEHGKLPSLFIIHQVLVYLWWYI